MRFSIPLAVAAGAALVEASPSGHRHHHRHAGIEERAPKAPVATALVFEFEGKVTDTDKVCDMVKAGKWKVPGGVPAECSPTVAPAVDAPVVPIPIAKETPKPKAAGLEAYQKTKTESPDTPDSQDSPDTSSSIEIPETTDDSSDSAEGTDEEFPDGTIDCSEFPSKYGAVDIHWMKIGGWSGIQYPTISGGVVTDMSTAIAGDTCRKGAMCSYACKPGYQKSQWPSTQGATKQSVGGLLCNQNGKLALTNPQLSKKLCIKGTGATKVQNNLSKNAAICRTDYPGTESETIPLNTQPKQTYPLTCPDSKTYFQWDGKPTTAQYYINNQGVSKEKACFWGEDGSHVGNWAPSYLGVGQDIYGKTWLSISSTKQNLPKDYQPLDYSVEITGDGLSGKCKLIGGKYCSGDNYDNCNDEGCTVQVMSGEATYVLSD